MNIASPGRAPVRMRHALAGLEAGVLGALLLAGWLMLGSLWLHRSIWSGPNLFAIVFYGPDAYANAFLPSSPAGLALILFLYGVPAILWGIVWRDTHYAFLRLIGALTGLAVYALFFHVIWPQTRPLLALYAPNRQLQVAHMLWGIMLASSPRFARDIAAATGD